MSRWNISGAMVSATLLFLVAMIGLMLYDQRRMNQRLIAVEKSLAAPRPPRGPVLVSAAPMAGVPAALDANARRLRALVRDLEVRVQEVAARVDSVELGTGGAGPAPPGAPPPASAADGSAAAAAPAAREVPGGTAAYRDWLAVELAKVVDTVGLTDGQRRQGEAMIDDLVEEHFGTDLTSHDLDARWTRFSDAWDARLVELMTAEQKQRYAEHERRRRLDQVAATVQWTVSGVTTACDLTAVQKDRLRERLKGLFTGVYLGADATPGGGGGGGRADPGEWRGRLRTLVGEEVTAEQLVQFEEWFANNLDWTATPRSAGD